MNVKLVSITKSVVDEVPLNAEELIVYVARVSSPNNQHNTETSERLIRYLIEHKHWSPFEMCDMTVEIETSRAIAAQILRHRSFSFQEFCISGDSKIKLWYPESKSSKQVSIKSLYERFNSSYWARKGVIPTAKVYDVKSKTFVSKEILEVFKTGEKEVYKMTLGNGKTIKATKQHKFLTKNGFVELENISIGDFIATNGTPVYQDRDWLSTAKQESLSRNGLQYIADKAGVSYHTIRKWLKIHKLSFTRSEVSSYSTIWNKGLPSNLQPNFGKVHSAQIREKMRKSSRKGAESNFFKGSNISWRKLVANECSRHKALLAEKQGIDMKDLHLYEIDHILPVYSHPELAFDMDNLQLLPVELHRQKSVKESLESKYTAKYAIVTNIEYVGKEMTYDLEVNHESHNYVANGIISHNSQRYSEITDFEPIKIRKAGSTNRQSSLEEFDPIMYGGYASELINQHIQESEVLYRDLLDAGVAKECARFVLPLTTQTRLYMKGSIRSWIHYLQVRLEESTQLEHRQVAAEIYSIFEQQFPTISRALSAK